VREGEPTGDYIWLRQSVTFTANGQTRTLEIAVPVRPDATPAEVESLLTQAQAGMVRLTQTLDARVEAALSPQSAPAAAPPPVATAQRLVTPVAASTLHDHVEHEAPQPPAAASSQPAATPPASTAPARSAPVQPPAAPAPAASQPRPTPTRPSSPSPVPSAAQPAPPMPERAGEARPSAPPPTASGPELSRPEFLAAVAQMGLKPKDAMDRLGKRSLEGLNLREALESLRRQMLRSPDTPASSAAAPAPAEPVRTPPARAEASRAEAIASPSQRSRAPVQFDEEEDADFTFTVDEEGALRDLDDLDEDDAAMAVPGEPTYGAGPGELNDLDLDDVPDFGPPPGRAGPPASSSRVPARAASPRASTAPSAAPSASATPAGAGKATAARGAANARALDLIKQKRSASAGGTASAQQRTAYRNIIVTELGEANARALIQGLWRVTPERLGPDQYDELISWGKQDTFADDVQLVLAALDAERQAAREEAGKEASANGGPSRTTPPATPRPRPGATGTSRGDR